MAHLLLAIILVLCLQRTSAYRVTKGSLLLSLKPTQSEESKEAMEEEKPRHASVVAIQGHRLPTEEKSQHLTAGPQQVSVSKQQGHQADGAAHQADGAAHQAGRAALSASLRSWRLHPEAEVTGKRTRRSMETSLTVQDEITKVLTVNTLPGMRQRLHCGRFCEYGVCNILHIPGLFERRYCTCLPNYTGLQCHMRVVPDIH